MGRDMILLEKEKEVHSRIQRLYVTPLSADDFIKNQYDKPPKWCYRHILVPDSADGFLYGNIAHFKELQWADVGNDLSAISFDRNVVRVAPMGLLLERLGVNSLLETYSEISKRALELGADALVDYITDEAARVTSRGVIMPEGFSERARPIKIFRRRLFSR